MSAGRFSGLDLTKVAVGPDATPCSVALVELILAMISIDDLHGKGSKRDLSDAEDQRLSALENRRSALEDQIKREVAEKLGVEWDILDTALS